MVLPIGIAFWIAFNMSQLSDKILEVYTNMVANNEVGAVWRGVFTTQEWKIIINRAEDSSQIDICAWRRDGGSGDPE